MARAKKPDFDRLDDVDVYVQSVPHSVAEEKRLQELLRKEIAKSYSRAALAPARKTKQLATKS